MDPRVVIADLRERMTSQQEQLDRIEGKLDQLLEVKPAEAELVAEVTPPKPAAKITPKPAAKKK